MTSIFDDYESPADTPSTGKKRSAAEQAYQNLQISEQAERVIRQQGRSATPEFLVALGQEIISQAGGRAR